MSTLTSTIISVPNPVGGVELPTPMGGPVRPTHLDTTGESGHNGAIYTRKEQTEKVLHTIRAREVKIAVISNSTETRNYAADKACATSVATELNKMLSGSKALVYEFEIKNKDNWFEYLRSVEVRYYIFVNFPPHDPYYSTTRESEFFSPRSRRISEVVVVRDRKLAMATTPGGTRTTSYTPVHYLEKFQHLDGSPRDIASKALCHFAASQPIPHPTDKVFWSVLPKVHHILKPQNSLGIAIMTREMASRSPFPRIVLVKSLADECVPTLKQCIGKYTHIQSFNGILLDGLSIADATTVFQSAATLSSVQLVVRYVHPIKTLPGVTPGLIRGVPTMATPVSPIAEKRPADRIDPNNETLPIPLMILGDIHVRCKELFRRLSGHMDDAASLVSADNDMDSQVSNRSGSNCNMEQNTLVASGGAGTTTLRVPQPTRSETSVSSYEGSDTDSSHFRSDKYVKRLSVSRTLFNNCGLSSPSTTPIRPVGHPAYIRQNTYPSVDKRYILNMFTQEMDRKFVHLFLRQSGIYLVVVSLDDVVADPVIQFENLSYWLRLVQTYVRPSGIKRVMIVGMSDGPMASEKERECITNLEGAIKEAEFPHVFFMDNVSVINFDRSAPTPSVDRLCSAIGKCMDAVMQRAFHFNKPFFDQVFHPFTGLTDVLLQMNRCQDTVVSSDDLLSIYKCYDDNYFSTLAAHSSALVDDRLDTLLKPGFLMDLLKKLSLTSDNFNSQVFGHDIPQLKGLPIVLNPWPMAQIDQTFTTQQQTSIMKWAERYDLFYSLGYSALHEVYFIPLLSTEFLADDASYDWPEEEEPWYHRPDTTVLYAKLNFSAIDHFFYLVLTEILKDVVNNTQHNPNARKCYINYGCTEAIMPVYVSEVNADITVYLRYHLLQNVIEFRTNSQTRQQYLYQVADSKLKAAYSHSKYAGHDGTKSYKGAVGFNIPHEHYDPDLLSSSTGKLCRLQPAAASSPRGGEAPLPEVYVLDDDSLEDQQLLRMKRVTDKEWLSASQDMKFKIPADTFIRWGRRLSSEPDDWAMVASKLQLMSRDDVDFYRSNPKVTGNGGLVLSKWAESGLTYKELTSTLRCEDVRLHVLADEIEGYFGTDV